jgi:hypothetical protein
MSLNTIFTKIASKNQILHIGTQIVHAEQWYSHATITSAEEIKTQNNLVQTFFSMDSRWTRYFQTSLALQFSNYYTPNQQFHHPEPRLTAQYLLTNNQKIAVSLAAQSKTMPLAQDNLGIMGAGSQRNFGLLKSYNADIKYTYTTASGHQLEANPFFQYLTDAPFDYNGDSFLNFYDKSLLFLNGINIAKNGTGTNYGIALQARKYLDNNYYYLLNATVLKSTYAAENGKNYTTRWDRPYLFNATGGKEWTFNKKLTHILGVNLHAVAMAGALTNTVNEAQSKANKTTIYDYKNPYNVRLQDYFRTDMRIYWKRNRTRYNSMLSLDIQNATNRLNEQYLYYEQRAQKTTIKTQLGLLPILSYRVEI